MNVEKLSDEIINNNIKNGTSSLFGKYWEYFLDEFGIPLGQYCVRLLYTMYTNFTLFNVLLFLLKCIPTGMYMHRLIKNVYVTSQERMKLKQLELDDIKLQIQIVKTKLSVRDAEFTERKKLLRKKADQLNKVRAKVRELIAADNELRNALNNNSQWGEEMDYSDNTQEEECTFIVELLKELKYDQVAVPETEIDKMSGGDPSEQRTEASAETSAYSTTSGGGKQDCQIKIIKVTNVYKVAYLRHYIKQKRLRRANKQALFRKKMDSIKKLLDEWHRTLNMVINSKLSLLNMDSQYIQIASQEAMGDCSKQNFYVFSDSDSDFRNSADNCHDDYTDYNGENASTREYYDLKEYGNNTSYDEQCICNKTSGMLYNVPEETRSQIEIEEIKGDAD